MLRAKMSVRSGSACGSDHVKLDHIGIITETVLTRFAPLRKRRPRHLSSSPWNNRDRRSKRQFDESPSRLFHRRSWKERRSLSPRGSPSAALLGRNDQRRSADLVHPRRHRRVLPLFQPFDPKYFLRERFTATAAKGAARKQLFRRKFRSKREPDLIMRIVKKD